jgi:hypothetical protein
VDYASRVMSPFAITFGFFLRLFPQTSPKVRNCIKVYNPPALPSGPDSWLNYLNFRTYFYPDLDFFCYVLLSLRFCLIPYFTMVFDWFNMR